MPNGILLCMFLCYALLSKMLFKDGGLQRHTFQSHISCPPSMMAVSRLVTMTVLCITAGYALLFWRAVFLFMLYLNELFGV